MAWRIALSTLLHKFNLNKYSILSLVRYQFVGFYFVSLLYFKTGEKSTFLNIFQINSTVLNSTYLDKRYTRNETLEEAYIMDVNIEQKVFYIFRCPATWNGRGMEHSFPNKWTQCSIRNW